MIKNKQYFVTAIGTDVGKTIVSAVLVNSLNADYWKPIQCGNLEETDSDFIRKNTDKKVFPEKYQFKLAASPHIASVHEKTIVLLDDFLLPETTHPLIVEGAGGMMVPINNKNELVIDIASKFKLEVIVVASFYLGSINHTLLTLEYAKKCNLKIAMLIFTGDVNESSLEAIQQFYPTLKIGFVPKLEEINKESISDAANLFSKKYLNDLV